MNYHNEMVVLGYFEESFALAFDFPGSCWLKDKWS